MAAAPIRGGCDEFCACDVCFGGLVDEEEAINLLPKETRGAAYDVFSKSKKASTASRSGDFKSGDFKPVAFPVLPKRTTLKDDDDDGSGSASENEEVGGGGGAEEEEQLKDLDAGNDGALEDQKRLVDEAGQCLEKQRVRFFGN